MSFSMPYIPIRKRRTGEEVPELRPSVPTDASTAGGAAPQPILPRSAPPAPPGADLPIIPVVAPPPSTPVDATSVSLPMANHRREYPEHPVAAVTEPEPLARSFEPTPYPFTPKPPEHKPGTGWKGRLAAMGQGALAGLGMSGDRGLGGAIGGALTGAIVGASSPKTVARWQNEAEEARWLPKHTREVQEANALRDDERQQQEQELRERFRRDKMAEDQAHLKERMEQRASEKAEARAAAAVARSQSTGKPVDLSDVKGTSLERWAGEVVPRAEKAMTPYERESLDIRKQEADRRAATDAAKAEAAASVPNFDVEVKKRVDQWRDSYFGTIGITPDVLAAARQQLDPNDPLYEDKAREKKEANDRIRQADNELYNRAKDSVASDAAQRKAAGRAGAGREAARNPSSAQPRLTKKNAKVGQRYAHDGHTIEIDSIESDGTVHYHQVQ